MVCAGVGVQCVAVGVQCTIILACIVTPIYKGGSRGEAKNYRPVALTSHIVNVSNASDAS